MRSDFRRRLSLRARLTSWSVGLLALTLLAFSFGSYVGLRTYLKLSLQKSYASVAHTIAKNYLLRLPEKGPHWVFGEISELYPRNSSNLLIRISTGNQVLYETGIDKEGRSPFDAIPLESTIRPEGAFHRFDVEDDVIMLYSMPFSASNGQHFEIEVGSSLAIMTATLHSLARIFFLCTPLILILAAIGGQYLMKRPLRPLLTLTEKAERIGRKEMGERLPVLETGDELESLTHSLNRMIGRLEEALAHNHRFSADASHELRTPLTIMRGELEEMLLLKGLPAQATENLVSALEEIDRMSRLVHSLMAITRLDVGGERIDLQPVDICALTRSTIEQMRLLAVERGLPLTLACPSEAWILADPFRIKQVLVNLVDNAIKYTPARDLDIDPDDDIVGEAFPNLGVEVSILTTETSAIVEVADHGIGIASPSLPHVFDRFYRADYARSRVAGGVGLGLAIVKSIVTAHHGSVSARSIEGVGSTMRVELPLLSSAQRSTAQPRSDAAPVPRMSREHPLPIDHDIPDHDNPDLPQPSLTPKEFS